MHFHAATECKEHFYEQGTYTIRGSLGTRGRDDSHYVLSHPYVTSKAHRHNYDSTVANVPEKEVSYSFALECSFQQQPSKGRIMVWLKLENLQHKTIIITKC